MKITESHRKALETLRDCHGFLLGVFLELGHLMQPEKRRRTKKEINKSIMACAVIRPLVELLENISLYDPSKGTIDKKTSRPRPLKSRTEYYGSSDTGCNVIGMRLEYQNGEVEKFGICVRDDKTNQ